MAAPQVFILGVDRSNLVDRQSSVNYTRDVNGQGTASFTMADEPSGFVPDDGMEVLIKQDGSNVFGGIINTRPRGFRGPDSPDQLTFYSISVASWEQRLNKRRVWRSYVDVAFEDIVDDINTDFLDDEGFTTNVLAGSVITITFNGESVAECLDKLCSEETDGRIWFSTPDQVITVQIQSSTPAPVTLNATNVELNSPAPTIEPDRTGYANRVTVVGGNPELPILYTAEDVGEIAARKAAEGGSGVYHYTVEDNEIKSANQATQRAEGILEQKSTIRDRFICLTDVQGFEVAQQVTIDLPNLEVDVLDEFFIISIDTVVAPGAQEFHHTITAILGPIDGGWQSEYRRNIQPKTIPMQIEATPGLVRVLPEPGVLIHDPPKEPTEWFQGALSGLLPRTPTTIGITNQEQGLGGLALNLRRGTGLGTEGCGGAYPGCGGSPNCFANRQSFLEGYPIDTDEKIGVVATLCVSWDELAGSSFKAGMVVNPDNTLCAFVERGSGGADPIFGVVGLDGSGFRGSVVGTGMQDNNTGFEGAWVGDYVYIPSTVTGGSIFVFDVSDPDNPTLEDEFVTTATGSISSVVPNSAGTALYAIEAGGLQQFIALDITDPTAITEEDVQIATGMYVSLGLDQEGSFDDDQLICISRATDTTARYARLPLTDAHTFGTLDEQTLAVAVGSAMEGWTCLYHIDSAIVWKNRNPTNPANSQQAHIFTVHPVDGVSFVQTLTYTHGTVGNANQARSYIGKRFASWFSFNTNAQVTFGVAGFDKIVPYEIEKPLRTEFGGTGIEGEDYEKGDILAASGTRVLERLPSILAPEGAFLRKRAAEDTGLAWEGGIGWAQVAIDDTDSPYTPTASDVVILADASAGPITINLPAVANSFERVLVIKNDGDGSFDVTVDPNGIETIDGDPTRVLGQDDVLGVTGSVNEWEVIISSAVTLDFTQRGYIDGLTTELASDSDHDVTIFPGCCADVLSGNDEMVLLLGEITKQIDAAWVEGDAAGGMFTGTVAADTEYNLIIITKDSDGTVGAGFDTLADGANKPSGWTARRRIGSVFTNGSSNIREYKQTGDRFIYNGAVIDVNDASGTIGVYETGTLSVPGNTIALIVLVGAITSGVRVGAAVRTSGATGTATQVFIRDDADSTTRQFQAPYEVVVDANSKVDYTISFGGTWDGVSLNTYGWIDDRGRDALPEEDEVTMIRIDFQELIENSSGVAKTGVHASMNMDSAAFRFGSVQDRAYLFQKLPENFVGQECHLVGVFTHNSGALSGGTDDAIKLEIGYQLYDNDESMVSLGVINDATAPNEVDIDHAFPFQQYRTQALQLAVFTPASTERMFSARITRDGIEETADGNRLATNLLALHVYIVPTADDVGGFVIPDTVV